MKKDLATIGRRGGFYVKKRKTEGVALGAEEKKEVNKRGDKIRRET